MGSEGHRRGLQHLSACIPVVCDHNGDVLLAAILAMSYQCLAAAIWIAAQLASCPTPQGVHREEHPMRRLRLLQLPLSAAPNEEAHVGAPKLGEIDRAP